MHVFLNEETKMSRNHQLPSACFSYDKYMKAYGCELQKGHFPYQHMDGIGKLEDSALHPQEALYSRLKNEGISDDIRITYYLLWYCVIYFIWWPYDSDHSWS